jgi:hypothetical protein
MNKRTALLEFALNLVEQHILTKRQIMNYYKDFNWIFYNFELGYWIQELNRGFKEKFI